MDKYNRSEIDENEKNTYNVYINSDKNKNSKKKYHNSSGTKSDLENFINSRHVLNENSTIDEEELNEYDDDLNDITMLDYNKNRILKILDISTLCIVCFFLFVLFIHNIICISITTKEVEANIREIASNEIMLESKQNKLNKTTQENLIEIFDEYGYFYVEDYKSFIPDKKNEVQTFEKTTNWFDKFCNFIYKIFKG